MDISAKITNKAKDAKSYVKAFASVLIDGEMVVNGFRVMEGKKGLFVGMPQTSYKDKDGKIQYNDIAFPITSEARQKLVSTILDVYETSIQKPIDETISSAKELLGEVKSEIATEKAAEKGYEPEM